MGLKDGIIDDAVEAAINQTDLEPGEVNRNIKQVMDTMEESYRQFDQIKRHLQAMHSVAGELDDSSQDIANAAIELSKASQNIGEAVNDLEDTQADMKENINDFTEVMEKFQEHLPEDPEDN